MIFSPIICKLDHVTFVPIFAYPDIDECESAPCVFGTCTDQENGYTCTCEDGFTGTDCDIGMYFIYFILQNNFTIRLAVVKIVDLFIKRIVYKCIRRELKQKGQVHALLVLLINVKWIS